MSVRVFAAVFGVVFLLAGASGFIPGLSPEHTHPGMVVTSEARLALGLFPVNVLHNLVHLAFGVWGLLAARTVVGSVVYGKGVAIIYGLLTLLGLIPATNAGLALLAAYFGFVHNRNADIYSRA